MENVIASVFNDGTEIFSNKINEVGIDTYEEIGLRSGYQTAIAALADIKSAERDDTPLKSELCDEVLTRIDEREKIMLQKWNGNDNVPAGMVKGYSDGVTESKGMITYLQRDYAEEESLAHRSDNFTSLSFDGLDNGLEM